MTRLASSAEPLAAAYLGLVFVLFSAAAGAQREAQVLREKPVVSNPYKAGRSVTMGRHGMVASSVTHASQAGMDMLRSGGNAADAAIATAAALSVVEPMMTGPGGDVFILYYEAGTGKIHALNGTGRAPMGLRRAHFAGKKRMPGRGWETVTVPGAVGAWLALHERFGSKSLSEVMGPAIRLAEYGYPVTQITASVWLTILQADLLAKETWTINGNTPKAGEVFRNPRIGKTFRLIAEGGHEAFYRGPIAAEIVRWSDATGGFLKMSDFDRHTVDWTEPIRTNYRGYEVYQHGPNSQGIGALIMLNILEGFDLGSMRHNSPEFIHLLVETKKLASADLGMHVGDPDMNHLPVEWLLSKEYAAERRSMIDPRRAMPIPAAGLPAGSDTIYLTTIDSKGNAVSLVNTQYGPWGAGVSAGEARFTLQNRGSGFNLIPGHVNEYAPGKRPFHTNLAGMITRNGELYWSYGLMGGGMQPQGHVQLITGHIDAGLNIQETADVPRWRHSGERLHVEWGTPVSTVEALRALGHNVKLGSGPIGGYGGAQIIMIDPATGTYFGASDPRKDGAALGY